MHEKINTKIACAYIRGKECFIDKDNRFFSEALSNLSNEDLDELMRSGLQKGINLNNFKQKSDIPRIKKVLGILRGLQFDNILDIGTGKGFFLWSFLETFPDKQIHCIDINEHYVDVINTINKGGINNVSASVMDAKDIKFDDNSFDVVTMLEVLEHIQDYKCALKQAFRVAKKFLIISFPSKPDTNPKHIRFIKREDIDNFFKNYKNINFKFLNILNHTIIIIRKLSDVRNT